MSEPIKPQIITDAAGHPAFAVIPYRQFLALVEKSAMEDREPTIPHAVVAAHIDGASMIRAWREHLGLTQQNLAERLGISQPTMAKLERLDARPRLGTLRKVAAALGIAPEQLR